MKCNVEESQCIGCGACEGACPVAAISMNEEGKAVIDAEKCINFCQY